MQRSIADQVGQDFFDDADSKLGLRAGQTDGKGRQIVSLPSKDPYRPELEGKSPEEMAEILARDDEQREDADANNVEQLMKEAPGGRTKRSGGRSGKRARKKVTGAPRNDDCFVAHVNESDDREYRPEVVSGRVSIAGAEALRRASAFYQVSLGVILDEIGAAFSAGATWDELRDAIDSTARVAAERLA